MKANTSVHSKPKQVFYYFDDYFKNMNRQIHQLFPNGCLYSIGFITEEEQGLQAISFCSKSVLDLFWNDGQFPRFWLGWDL